VQRLAHAEHELLRVSALAGHAGVTLPDADRFLPRDMPGLIWAFRLTEDGKAEPIPATACLDALHNPDLKMWVHLSARDSRLPGLLSRLSELPEAARACLTDRDEHLSIGAEAGTVYGVFPDFERDFEGHSWTIGRFHFALSERLLITVRRHPLYSLEQARLAIAAGPRASPQIRAPVDILEVVVGQFQGRISILLDQIGDTIDKVEDSVFDDEPRDERKTLGPVRRTLVRLHRHLRSAAGLLRRLDSQARSDLPPGVIAATDRMSHRLGISDLDVMTLQERARLLHEEIDSKLNAQTNRHLFVLSILSAFLLPPTLVVGFFGMNTSDMPFQNVSGGTWYAAGLCGVAVAGAWWLLRRRGIGG
jgi:zinc transporter